MKIQSLLAAWVNRTGFVGASLILVCGSSLQAQEPAILHVAKQEPVLHPVQTAIANPQHAVAAPSHRYAEMNTSGQEQAGSGELKLEAPGLLFGSAPIGNGVHQEAGPQLSRRFQQPPAVSARQIPQPAASPNSSSDVPIYSARLPKRSDVVRERSQAPIQAQASPNYQLLLAGQSQFQAGIENSFAVVVVNPSDQDIENLEIVLQPAAGFKVTVLDRECEIDRRSGSVRWVIPLVEANVNEVIQFRAITDRRGKMTHSIEALDANGKKSKSAFTSISR